MMSEGTPPETNQVPEGSVENTSVTPQESHEAAHNEAETTRMELEVQQAGEFVSTESFTHLTKMQLLDRLKEMARQDDVAAQVGNMQNLKKAFNALRDEEKESQLQKFTDDGGDKKDFVFTQDATDDLFQELLKGFELRRQELKRKKDKEQQESTKIRSVIVEELKQLAESCDKGLQPSIKQVFEQLHQLQERWKNSGLPLHSEAKKLSDNYKFYNDEVYKFIKIDKEIRELHFKKNLQIKTELCEKAERFITEENLKNAIEGIKALLEEWKNTGAVGKEHADTLWERFKSAADQVFMRQKENVQELLHQQEENLVKKLALLRKMDDIVEQKHNSAAQWIKASEAAESILSEWKNTGFAPREENEKVWELFKESRQKFFKAKEEFFDAIRKVHQENYKIKNDLCMQVEALKDSQDWKKTTELIISLQKKWKEAGPVAYKHSDKIWNRFRAACDHFFDSKKAHFAGQDADQESNLKLKEALLEKIKSFQLSEDNNANYEALKSLQNEWIAIGHVPMKVKDKINKAYRDLLDKHFDAIRAGNAEKNKNFFQHKYEALSTAPGGKSKMNGEVMAIQDRIRKKESEAALLENNIGFFANSKNAEGIIRDTQKKIEIIRKDVSNLKDQLKLLRSIHENVPAKQSEKSSDSAVSPE